MSKELRTLIIKINKSHWNTEQEKDEINHCIDVIKEREEKATKYDSIINAKPSEALEELLNKAFNYGVQATLDNLLIRGYDTKDMLRKQDYSLTKDIDKDKEILIQELLKEVLDNE